MIDSTPLPVVVDQSSAGTTQLVVEADAGSQAEKALHYALSEALDGSSPVTFQGEDVFAGVEDRFDPLAKWSKVRTLPRLVFALGPDRDGSQVSDGRSELPARVSLVGKQDLPALSLAARKEFQPDLPFVSFGRAIRKGAGSPVCGKDGVQPYAPEVAGVRGAVSVVTEVGKSRTQRRLPASCAFDRGGVDEQEVVRETGALPGKDDQKPVKDGSESAAALEVARLLGDNGKQMGKRSLRPPKETPVGGLTHDGLGHRQRDDLGIGRVATGVSLPLWQKVIGCAINEGAEGVEVGVHRGLLVDGVSDTADFGPSASNPFCTAIFVESII
jgi:hypothetical protein